MDLAVVGAGAVGSAVAADLAEAGARVTVLEERALLQGTSGTSFAWVNANNKVPPAYYRLNLAGLQRHRAGRAAGRTSFHPVGHLEVAFTDEHLALLEPKVARLRERGYAVQDVPAAQAAQQLPGIRAEAVRAAVRYPEEGYCDVPAFVAEAHERLRAAGGEVRTAAVERLAPGESGVEVRLGGGERERFTGVVVATGRWTTSFLARSGFHVPLNTDDAVGAPPYGFLATTQPVDAAGVASVVSTTRVNFRPAGGGRYLLQGLDLDVEAHPAAPDAVRARVGAELARRFADVVGLPAAPAMEDVAVGIRPLPADGQAVAGFLDDARTVYVAVTHSGVTLAPELAALATREVVHGEQAPALAGFRPQRFAGGAASGAVAAARRPGEQ
ncbi:NAD(P)/FAD-dependent oxidoreductase [Pseudonocardia kunmingensis]|uniref:Glycine/D-amino acid oxidase-like deaminating enzyme n=1 Tax=Pseudonocardia kunmingensis TaxID=630975 RepID=A0A543DR10_9PSEU|nr:FAD-binding oxidoreductase [Pseudonocardia kunmingensis]TQM11763.1 glycine/D-amino acid oxidase-like deaminating enzyme [Pseudonocardia kunmingensis]